MALLGQQRVEKPEVKSIVFSQFTGMLNLVQRELVRNGFNFVRLDGSMAVKKRKMALESFAREGTDTPSVFLMSLKAAGTCDFSWPWNLSIPASHAFFFYTKVLV